MTEPQPFDPADAIRRAAPGVSDDAPPAFKDRYAAMVDALAVGHCPECLEDRVDSEGIGPDGRPTVDMNMPHLPGCPLSREGLETLATQLGYSWALVQGSKVNLDDDDLSAAIEDLGIEE